MLPDWLFELGCGHVIRCHSSSLDIDAALARVGREARCGYCRSAHWLATRQGDPRLTVIIMRVRRPRWFEDDEYWYRLRRAELHARRHPIPTIKE